MKRTILAITIVVWVASIGFAQEVDPEQCSATIHPAAIGASIFNVPNGTGVPFTEAFAPGGMLVDATITLTVKTKKGELFAGFLQEDMWLESSGSGLGFCIGGTQPDGNADDDGQAFWSLNSLRAGGCTEGELLVVYVDGEAIGSDGLDLRCKSPDFNGDLIVNLSDAVYFAYSLFTPTYCADFTNDGVVNLSDIVRFTPTIWAECQEPDTR